eukprot:5130036-Alexandrium_andersonii.AAC.1
MRAGDASSPAAREAFGPPALGAHPSEVRPARVETGRCCAGATLVEVDCLEQAAVDYRQRPAMDGRVRVRWLLSEGRWRP